jgi:hypothetical protein
VGEAFVPTVAPDAVAACAVVVSLAVVPPPPPHAVSNTAAAHALAKVEMEYRVSEEIIMQLPFLEGVFLLSIMQMSKLNLSEFFLWGMVPPENVFLRNFCRKLRDWHANEI